MQLVETMEQPPIYIRIQVDDGPVHEFATKRFGHLAESGKMLRIPANGGKPAFIRINVQCVSEETSLYAFGIGWNDMLCINESIVEGQTMCFGERRPWIPKALTEKDVDPRFYVHVQLNPEANMIVLSKFCLAKGVGPD